MGVGEAEDWDKWTEIFLPVYRTFRYSQAMIGTFEPDPIQVEPTQRQQTQRRQKSQAVIFVLLYIYSWKPLLYH